MFEKGKLAPNLVVEDETGQQKALSAYRQKSHVALVKVTAKSLSWLEKAKSAFGQRRRHFDWLKTIPLFLISEQSDIPEGVFVIDRYGRFLNSFPLSEDVWDHVGKEIEYYEAFHC